MKQEMKIFENEEFGEIRTMQDEQGEVLFCAKDVCEALGYEQTDKAVHRHVEEADRMKRTVRSGGQNRTMFFINESGLYALILGSKLEAARRFKHWVTSEVLPIIRRDGGYMLAREGESNEVVLARALLVMKKAVERRDEQIAELEVPAQYAMDVLEARGCLTTTQIAKELEMTAIELNRLLCRMKIQYFQSNQYLLYADYARRGFAKNRTHGYKDVEGVVHTRSYLVWTERGRAFLHDVVKNPARFLPKVQAAKKQAQAPCEGWEYPYGIKGL